MKKILASLGIARGTAAICVAYMFVHAGSGALTQLAMIWHAQSEWTSEDGLLFAFGMSEIFGALGLFASNIPLRALSAIALLMASLAPRAGVPAAAVSGWCTAVTAVLALIPRIPLLRPVEAKRAFQLALAEIEIGDPASNRWNDIHSRSSRFAGIPLEIPQPSPSRP